MNIPSALYALSDAFGLALLHSLWQFSLLILVAFGIRRLVQPWLCAKSAYRFYFGVLLLATGLFCYTFADLYEPPVYANQAAEVPTIRCAETDELMVIGAASVIDYSEVFTLEYATDLLRGNTVLISLLWLMGCVFYSLAYARALRQLRRLKRSAKDELPADWAERFAKLLHTTGIKRNVTLAVSPLVNGPLTLGHLKPVILLPVGLLLQLPVAQLEAILLHELGHIQRYDYLANLLQNGLKTLFFYHPAVHLLCAKIDEERENACDDFAVAHNQNPVVLVRALSALTLHRQATLPHLALHLSNPNYPIVNRLHRLLNSKKPVSNMHTSRFFLPLGLLLCYGLFVAAAKGPFVAAEPLSDCAPAAASDLLIEQLPPTPLAFVPLAPQPDLILPETSAFLRDTTPPAAVAEEEERSLLAAQMSRLKAAEDRLMAQQRKLAATQARLETEAAKMEARSRELEAEQRQLEQEAKSYGNSSYGTANQYTQDSKQSCTTNQQSLSLTTDKIVCLRDKLTTMLVEDGLINDPNTSVKLVLNPGKTLVNGRQLPQRLYNKYEKLFNDHCVKAQENRVIMVEGKNISVGDMKSSNGIDQPYLVGTSYSETND